MRHKSHYWEFCWVLMKNWIKSMIGYSIKRNFWSIKANQMFRLALQMTNKTPMRFKLLISFYLSEDIYTRCKMYAHRQEPDLEQTFFSVMTDKRRFSFGENLNKMFPWICWSVFLLIQYLNSEYFSLKICKKSIHCK